MEILPSADYEAYSARNRGKQGVTDTMDTIPGTGITLHRFVKEREEVTSTVQPLLVAEGAVISSPEVSRAISALKVPCKTHFRPSAGLMLPRVAAPSQQISAELEVRPLLILCKEFLVYSTTAKDVETFLELHKQCDEQLLQLSVEGGCEQSETQVRSLCSVCMDAILEHLADSLHGAAGNFQHCAGMQDAGEASQQQSLIARLRGLELDAAERTQELAKQHTREQEAAAGRRIMFEQEELLKKAGEAAAASKMYRAWEPVVGEFDALPQLPQPGQVLQYFSCEDGIKALRSHDLQHNTGAQEYERLQERLRTMPPSNRFAERGIYGVADHVPGPDDVVVEERQQSSVPDGAQGPTQQEATGPQDVLEPTTDSASQQWNETGLDMDPLATMQRSGKSPTRVKLPKIYRQAKATTALNDEYLRTEYLTKRLVKTSAAELIRARGRDDVEFELGCAVLDFGEVKQGGSPVVRKIPLQNVSLERARFSVDRVEPPLKVTYQRGPVPAGLKTHLMVEFCPEHVGNYNGEVVVRSPVNVLTCRVSACVTKSE